MIKAASQRQQEASAHHEGKRRKGGVHYGYAGQKVDKSKLSSAQRVGVDFAERLARRKGMTFYFYRSWVNEQGVRVYKDKSGKIVEADNGFYDPSDGSIHIDLNSGDMGDAVLFTIAHELTHFIQDWSPVKYRTLCQILIDGYTEMGQGMDQMVKNKQEEYRKKGKQLTYEEAYDEVIASSMESVLNDGRVMDLLDEVETKDKSLYEQIRSFIEDVAQLLHDTIQAYKDKRPTSPEGRIVQRMTGIYEQLQQVFAEGLHEGGENYREGGKENTAQQGGVKTQSRQGASAVYEKPAYERWEVETALADALEKKGNRHENVIKVGSLPKYIVNLIGIDGDMYIYRNHAYENMVSEDTAKREGRYKEDIHYHNHGEVKMADAIMSLENPILTICEKGRKYGNPVVTMLLDVKGSNDAPLYATLGFYSGEGINGQFDVRPHLVLTIAERDMQKATPDEGRDSYEEVIRKAVEEGRIIDLDNEKRAALSVIAKQSRLGNVSAATLDKNLSQFKKEIKTFREEKKINYSVRYQVNQQAQRHLRQQNAGMGEDVADLNDLVAAQRKRGSEMKGTALYAAAGHLMKTAGAKGDKYELARLLQEYYRYIANDTALTWDGLRDQGQKVVDWLMDHTVRSKQISDYARDILNELRTSRIYLDDTQRGEVAHLYGSFGAYRNMLMGSIVIANDRSVLLDTRWQELALMYLSGTVAACKSGEWSSATARNGLWHKGGMILVVIVAAIADAVMVVICEHIPLLGMTWPGIILPLVLAWYIITEMGSILENAIKLGAKVPEWLVRLRKASLHAVDAAGEETIFEEADPEKESTE